MATAKTDGATSTSTADTRWLSWATAIPGCSRLSRRRRAPSSSRATPSTWRFGRARRERLARFAPPGLTRVFFVNSGAEANENALRIAFLATGRERVVALEGGFHGRTAAAAAVTRKHEGWYGFPRQPFPVTVVPGGRHGGSLPGGG